MVEHVPDGAVPETRRKIVFLALVQYQDEGLSVSESRKIVAHRFDLTSKQILFIEREGVHRQWPPL